MSLASFNAIMTHKITLKKRKRNSTGDFSVLSSIEELDGFVEYGNFLVVNEKNEDVKATAIVYLKDDCGIDINWPYWLIDQNLPQERLGMEVLKIYPIDNPKNGLTHHFEIMVR